MKPCVILLALEVLSAKSKDNIGIASDIPALDRREDTLGRGREGSGLAIGPVSDLAIAPMSIQQTSA